VNDEAYRQWQVSMHESIWSLAPLEARIESDERLPSEIVMPALQRMGAFGLIVPQEYGGAGLTVSQYLPILAEFAKVHGAIRVLVHVHNSFAHALTQLGTDEQKASILPGVAAGEKSLAFALTEPEFGTGLDTGTTAVRVGQDYVINGQKWLITNSDFASHFIVVAKTPDSGPDPLSALLVERDRSGLTIEEMPETMGCKGGQHGHLSFVDVKVPLSNVLGGVPGRGSEHMERALEISRLFVAASSLGTAEYSLDLSLQHARQRITFGKPIGQRQAVQRYLAEMATDIHALRLMLEHAASLYDSRQRITAESAMCKLFGLEAVGRVTDRALLVHGGIGYTRQTPIERLYRDARLNWLEEGPPTIQYMVTAREFLAGFWWKNSYRRSHVAH
jgi:alkylation response protein AidB-like acyl-CoA dehydrogenase